MSNVESPLRLRLDAMPWGNTQLSASGDVFVSRLVRMASGETLKLKRGQNDLLAVAGDGRIDTRCFPHGTYLSADTDAEICAGANGLTVFHFHRPNPDAMNPVVVRPRDRSWRVGKTAGIGRCDLRVDDYKVALVDFARGTQIRPHRHPKGEEIFILSGELQHAPEWMVPGDWRRLTPKDVHAPRSDTTTRILLLTGHLVAK